jgi:hypothetical protein
MQRSLLNRVAPVWLACVIIGSLIPWRPQGATGPMRVAGHIVVFGATTLLLLLIGRSAGQRFWALAAVIGLGIAIECSQHWIYHSPLEWWDMRTDAFAALGAYLLGQWPALHGALVRQSG